MQLELAFLERPAAPAAGWRGLGIKSIRRPRSQRWTSSRVSSRRCSRPAQRWRQAISDIEKISSSDLARVAVVCLRQSSSPRSSTSASRPTDSTPWRIRPVSSAARRSGRRHRRSPRSDRIRRSRAIWLRAVDRRGRLGHVGLASGLEVSRLARNNADWQSAYRPVRPVRHVDGDADGVTIPGRSSTAPARLKGTMSEAELYILRPGSTAAFGTRRRAASFGAVCRVGFVPGEADGEVVFEQSR